MGKYKMGKVDLKRFLRDNDIEPPEGYHYVGYEKNPFVSPELSGHLWMDGYACWRPIARL